MARANAMLVRLVSLGALMVQSSSLTANPHSLSGGVDVGVGFAHACAVVSQGEIYCWGDNQSGQLGLDIGMQIGRAALQVEGLPGPAVKVSAGSAHTCAIVGGGAVWCWGQNVDGQLGDGSFSNWRGPAPVVGLVESAIDVSLGGAHTCVLLESGAVRCFGRNDRGQIGDGSTVDRAIPVEPLGLGAGISGIAVGLEHSCARLAAGGVRCWGRGGTLGDGSFGIDRLTPVSVSGISSVAVSLDAGYGETCAVLLSGSVYCWGLSQTSPVVVSGEPPSISWTRLRV
jgi:alpha-tubulin suppressor-like RCC1 family protein